MCSETNEISPSSCGFFVKNLVLRYLGSNSWTRDEILRDEIESLKKVKKRNYISIYVDVLIVVPKIVIKV